MPLSLCVMSGKRKRDYKKVFKCLKRLLPSLSLQTITVDFEAAVSVWKAMRSVFPGVTLLGFSFHWTQTIWRKIQDLGLVSSYMNDDATHNIPQVGA